ncbi:MAG: hypothetical protein ACLU1S_04510 [Eubacterium sp.]
MSICSYERRKSMRYKSLKISVIVKDIINCFLDSCGIALLLLFFCPNLKEQIQGDTEIIICVKTIFILNIVLIFGFNIISKRRWFSEERYSSSVKKYASERISERNDKERKLISLHEAGHTVVALSLGVNISCVQINMENELTESGKTILEDKSRISMDEEYIKNIITIKYAGAATEKLIYKKYSLGSMGSIDSDFESAEELIKQMIITFSNKYNLYVRCGNGFDELVCENSQELFNKAQKIVEENIESIRKVADALMNKSILNQKEVREIISGEG